MLKTKSSRLKNSGSYCFKCFNYWIFINKNRAIITGVPIWCKLGCSIFIYIRFSPSHLSLPRNSGAHLAPERTNRWKDVTVDSSWSCLTKLIRVCDVRKESGSADDVKECAKLGFGPQLNCAFAGFRVGINNGFLNDVSESERITLFIVFHDPVIRSQQPRIAGTYVGVCATDTRSLKQIHSLNTGQGGQFSRILRCFPHRIPNHQLLGSFVRPQGAEVDQTWKREDRRPRKPVQERPMEVLASEE